jgi:hypothetical protein
LAPGAQARRPLRIRRRAPTATAAAATEQSAQGELVEPPPGAAAQETVPLPVHWSPEQDAEPVTEIGTDRTAFSAVTQSPTLLALTYAPSQKIAPVDALH